MRSITRPSQQLRKVGARAVVHVSPSMDVEPIDAFHSLLESLAVVEAPARGDLPVQTRFARVLEALAVDEVEEDLGFEWEDVDADLDLGHRRETELVEKQRELDEIHARELKLSQGVAREDDNLRGFPARWADEKPWRKPSRKSLQKARDHIGVRQEVVVKRFKRFGIKA